jgi:Zn-dependent protease with chaperone function
MQLIVLLVLSLACYSVAWPAPLVGPADVEWVLWVTAGVVGAFVAISWLIGWRTQRALRHPFAARKRIFRRYHRARLLYLLTCLAVYVGLLYLVGWGWAVQLLLADGVPAQMPVASELLLLAPYLLTWMAPWFTNYSAERALHDSPQVPFGSLGTHIASLLRQNAIVLFLPLGLLIARQNLLRLYPELETSPVFRAAQVGVFVLLAIFMPLLLRFTLRLTPLPAGPVRARLATVAQRLRFWSSDILVWDTRGQVANALIAGLLPWPRYVVFTDRLLAELTPEEVETVYGHEIGHIRCWHMPLYMIALTLSMMAFIVVWVAIEEYWFGVYPDLEVSLKAYESYYLAVPQVVMAIYVFILFGALSRRCERQADLVGCRTATDTRSAENVYTFMHALNKVCTVNGIDMLRPGFLQSWLHGTPMQRLAFLERVAANDTVAVQFERRLNWFKWGLCAVMLAIIVGVGHHIGWERVWARL